MLRRICICLEFWHLRHERSPECCPTTQVSKPVLSPIVSPNESPRGSLDQPSPAASPPRQQTRLQQNGRRPSITPINAVAVTTDGGVRPEPVNDLLTQYSSLYSTTPRTPAQPADSAESAGAAAVIASGHATATPAEVAAVAAAFGDYDDAAEDSPATEAYSSLGGRIRQHSAPSSPVALWRGYGSGEYSPVAAPPARTGSGSSTSPESPKLTNRRLESVIKPPRHSKRRRCCFTVGQ